MIGLGQPLLFVPTNVDIPQPKLNAFSSNVFFTLARLSLSVYLPSEKIEGIFLRV
jgi:hypothetical protein